MKKIVKCLLILLVCFIGIGTVSAREFETGEKFRKYYSHEAFVSGLQYHVASTGANTNYSNWSYRFHSNSDGTDFLAYCMDPHKKDGTNYKIDRILGESGSDLVKSFDLGIKKILELGYNQYTQNSTYHGVSGDNYYVATSIAIRTFMLGLYDWGGSAAYYQYKSSAHATLGAKWAAEYAQYSTVASGKCVGVSDVEQCFLNEVKKAYSWYNSGSVFRYSEGTVASSVIAAAKALFEEGAKAAADFRENGKTNGNISYTVGQAVQDERDGDTVKEHIIIDFKIENFDEEGVIHNFRVTPTSNNAGITIDSMEYSVDGVNYLPLNSSVDIAQAIPAENGIRNGSIKIRLNITKVVNDNCSNMTFTVNYGYIDPNIDAYQGALLKETSQTDKQRFLIITKIEEGQEQSGSIQGSIECAKEICDTQLSVPICSDDENEAISEITASEKIKKCILDNVDDAENSYQLSDSNGGVDNDYCKIFCKEDYKDVIDDGVPGGIKLNPVVEDVECGGFFQLTSHIEGKKDCYTGGTADDSSINREQYLADIEAAQRDMIDAMNRYLEADAKANSYVINTSSSPCSLGTSLETIEIQWDAYTQYRDLTFTNENGSTQEFTESSGTETFHDIDNHYCCGGDDPETGACLGWCCEITTTAQDQYDDFIEDWERIRRQAKEDYEQAYRDYEQAIKDFNGCTAAWTMEFPFEQRLKYYYSEYHYKDEYTPYYDLIQAAEDEELYYLDAVEDSLKEEYEVVICKGDTDDYYECQETPVTFEDSVDAEADEWNYVSEYGNSVYTDRTYVVCNDPSEGCVEETHEISDARFIRKTIKKSQDYITPTVFYQIEANGRVTVNSGYTGNALKLDALINSLPVSTTTTGGGIFKLLLEDLGEFYDTGETGRLIDFGGDHEEDSVAAALGSQGIETFDGEYVCHYYSPCRPDDCPDCDFVCDEDECHWGDPGTCPDCEFECINCIFNFDELEINFKPITTVDVTAPDREFGYNWDVSTSLGALELLRDKAEETINEIEEENETIYDKTGEDSALAFSIRMTPDIINYLKDYNESVEDEGGYANDSLTCYAATIDGKSYANIFCFSEVIDYLVDNYESQITVGNRTPEGSRSDEDNKANSNGYWSLWDWTEPSRDANGQYSVIGGPSWK